MYFLLNLFNFFNNINQEEEDINQEEDNINDSSLYNYWIY